MAKQKFYVVWEGHRPGVYTSWDAAKQQIDGYPQAKYKSFGSKAEAEKALRGSYWAYVGQNTKTVNRSPEELEKMGVRLDSLAVDAACSGNPGDMEYRGVHTRTGQEIFRMGPLPDGTNSVTVVESCRFKGSGGGGEKGNSALTRELPFSFMRIKRDGKYIVAGTR